MIAGWVADRVADGLSRGRACLGRFGLHGFVELGDGDRVRRAEWTLGSVESTEREVEG